MNAAVPRFLLLDIGGVLVGLNYEPLAAGFRALTGLEPARIQAVLTSGGLVEKFESGALTGREFHQEVCRRTGTPWPGGGCLDAGNSVFAGPVLTEEEVGRIARNARLWAISNTNELHFEFLSRRLGSLRHFEGLVLSYREGLLKPGAGIFARALERMRAGPGEVLFVDDQEANIRAAEAMGIAAVLFAGPERLAAELRGRGML
jgi:putative hydrolase of the HAD superfamily